MLEAEDATLQRMDMFESVRRRERKQVLCQIANWNARGYCASQQGLHVLRGIIEQPGLVIDLLPLLVAHSGMGSADVFDVIFVEVRVHCDAVLPEHLMILRSGKRRQAEELEKVDRQFVLDDRDVAPDGLRRVRWQAQDITSDCQKALFLPGE